MDVSEDYVRVCGEIGNFTERITGVSIVDAYFGPAELAPSRQSKDADSDTLHSKMMTIADKARDEIEDPLRSLYLSSEAESLALVCRWLGGADIPYGDLVSGLFRIDVAPFGENELRQSHEVLAGLLSDQPGRSLVEKVREFQRQGRVSGEELRDLIEVTLQKKSIEVGRLFREKIFLTMGETVTDNGVSYETVRGMPWAGYNYYQGNYRSINQFNIDRTFNRDSMTTVIYHEYEHHVSNLWREKFYRENGFLELSVVPLHTGRCVISEGTADTARDFLGIKNNDLRTKVTEELYSLRRRTSINAAFLLNVEGVSRDEATSYVQEYSLRGRKEAEGSLDFIAPTTNDGRPNLWAPYVFTYFIGRAKFVLPTWEKASNADAIPQFFRTLYLNPFSGSSATWNEAFSWLK